MGALAGGSSGVESEGGEREKEREMDEGF